MDRFEKDKRRDGSSGPSKLAAFGGWISSILVDPRQIVAGFLTFTMFAMLAHMIKREHFDSRFQMPQHSREDFRISFGADGLWKEDGPEMKACWAKPTSDEATLSEGYVTFSLTDGPEYHISQITDAVVVAKSLGATLVLPDIRGTRLGDKRNFEEVYDVDKLIGSLEGVVRVVKEMPSEISAKNLAVVKIPNRVTENDIAVNVEPVYRSKGNIRLATYFSSPLNMKKNEENSESDSVACQAMFGTLELQPELREFVDLMVERLRTLSRGSDGRFVAVDLRVNMLKNEVCQGKDEDGHKKCYNAKEVAKFLSKIGYDKDTTIYLTQQRWDKSLEPLKEFFPKTYTKESIIPVEKRSKFLDAEAPTLEEVIDFYIASESDVFVPAISGLFYANVAGKRIASGRTEILVPTKITGSSGSPSNFLSPYVTNKNHLAYSCFC